MTIPQMSGAALSWSCDDQGSRECIIRPYSVHVCRKSLIYFVFALSSHLPLDYPVFCLGLGQTYRFHGQIKKEGYN